LLRLISVLRDQMGSVVRLRLLLAAGETSHFDEYHRVL